MRSSYLFVSSGYFLFENRYLCGTEIGITNYVVSAALRDEYNIVKYEKKSVAGSNLFLFTIKIRQCIFAEIPVTFRKNIQFSNLIKVPRTVLQILSN